jgi:hypothetical protein
MVGLWVRIPQRSKPKQNKMNRTEILNAINSGFEVVSECNTKKLMLINDKLYFGIVGTFYSISVQNDNELKLYNWRIL